MPSPLESILALINQPDQIQAPPPNQNEALAKLLMGKIAPNLTDPKTYQPLPPPTMQPNEVGKLPTSDPRLMGAMTDVGNLATTAAATIGAGGPMGAAARGAGMVGAEIPQTASAALRTPAMTAAALMGGASDAEGAPLTPKQQADRQAQKLKIEADTKAAELAHQNKLREIEANRIAGEDVLKNEMARKQAEADFEAQKKTREANLPFREKYPNFTKALPAVGAAAAFGVPYGLRMGGRMAANTATRMWEKAAARASASPNAQNIGELKAFQKGVGTPDTGIGVGGMLGGALEPLAASSTPDINDLMFNPDVKTQDAAKARLMDPARVSAALLEGVPTAVLGAKAPMILPSRIPPAAASQGIIDSARNEAARATRAANKAKKK